MTDERLKLARAGLNGLALVAGTLAADLLMTVLTVASVMAERTRAPGIGEVLMNFVYGFPLCLIILGFAQYFTRRRGVRDQVIAGAVMFGLLFVVGMGAAVLGPGGWTMVLKVLTTPLFWLGTLAALSVGAVGALVAAQARIILTARHQV